MTEERINHPQHYGGDTVYETIKVIEAWGLGFNLGNAVKYISRAGKKGDHLEDLKKAQFYLNREISNLEGGNDLVGNLDSKSVTADVDISPPMTRDIGYG